ncbi:hypothetical protein IFM89_027591 [Coptis chinensis]|uniref:F-box domain-containing protein n=1 Tax=Coptis chinensis TaxID=261450 RepID=A0A835IT05_9MAGN|nr:hypothetical protein IFM89_027591 [Coptis chinensis]
MVSKATEAGGLDLLPTALLASIMTKLDIPSICSAAATCKTFNACVSQILSFLPNFHLLDVAPSINLLRPLLPPNPYLRSLKIDCSRLDDSSIDNLIRPSLHELCLHNCEDFTGDLISAIGKQCRDLRSLYLGSVAERRGHAIDVSDLEQLLGGCSLLEVRPIQQGTNTQRGNIGSTGSRYEVLGRQDSQQGQESPEVGQLRTPNLFPRLQRIREGHRTQHQAPQDQEYTEVGQLRTPILFPRMQMMKERHRTKHLVTPQSVGQQNMTGGGSVVDLNNVSARYQFNPAHSHIFPARPTDAQDSHILGPYASNRAQSSVSNSAQESTVAGPHDAGLNISNIPPGLHDAGLNNINRSPIYHFNQCNRSLQTGNGRQNESMESRDGLGAILTFNTHPAPAPPINGNDSSSDQPDRGHRQSSGSSTHEHRSSAGVVNENSNSRTTTTRDDFLNSTEETNRTDDDGITVGDEAATVPMDQTVEVRVGMQTNESEHGWGIIEALSSRVHSSPPIFAINEAVDLLLRTSEPLTYPISLLTCFNFNLPILGQLESNFGCMSTQDSPLGAWTQTLAGDFSEADIGGSSCTSPSESPTCEVGGERGCRVGHFEHSLESPLEIEPINVSEGVGTFELASRALGRRALNILSDIMGSQRSCNTPLNNDTDLVLSGPPVIFPNRNRKLAKEVMRLSPTVNYGEPPCGSGEECEGNKLS